jgi:outer membrane receptor protein involved in Fe transport
MKTLLQRTSICNRAVIRLSRMLTVILALSLPSLAQIQNGQFTGVVTDPSGAVLPGATLTVKNLDTGLTLTTTSNDSGLYTAREVPIGRYKITVEVRGFKTVIKTDLILNAGTIQRVDFQLPIGGQVETVEVVGGATPVNTESAKLSETVGAAQIANLPLNGRNVYDLIQQAPGAVNATGVMYENGANTVVNGVRENFNGFLINGVSNKGLSGGYVNLPIQDTVQEFQLLTLNNSAEFGNSAGATTNLVTKSGTNDYHGSAWWFVRNDIFDANSFFLNQKAVDKPPLRFNQFGGTLGGPIKKDKFFFFASYQGEHFLTSAPPVPAFVESEEFRQASVQAFPGSIAALLYSNFPPNAPRGNPITLNDYVTGGFSGSGFTSFAEYLCSDLSSPAIAAKFAQLMGVKAQDRLDLANLGCSSIPAETAGLFGRDMPFLLDTVAVLQSQNQRFSFNGNLFQGNEASVRLDYNFSPNDRVFSQMNWSRATDKFGQFSEPTALRGFTLPFKAHTPNFQLSYIHSFSPTVLNEVRAGYAGNISDAGATLTGVPFIGFDDGTIGFGSYSGYPNFFKENIYTYSELLSISKGKHSLKMGADVRRNLENSTWEVGRPSYYFFDSLFFAADAPYEEFAGVDPGIIGGQPAQLATNIRHWRNVEVGAYFQDDWKATRRLTLNLGLRYDLYTRHRELNDLATTFLLGPGQSVIDNISTGAGRVKAANAPAGAPGCDTPPQIRLAQLAGICGPGGFAPAKVLGAGDHNDFGPRLGFAWDLFGNGNTSLRGGFGLSYEGTLYNPLSNTRWNLPYFSSNLADNFLVGDINNVAYGSQSGEAPRFTGPPDPLNFQGTGAPAMGNINAWDPNNPNLAGITSVVFPEGLRDPYVYNWYLGVQREILPKLMIEVNYVGTAGHKLFRAENVNRIPGGRLPEGTCVLDNFGRKLCSQIDSTAGSTGDPLNPVGRLNPNFDSLRVWKNVVNSIYDGLQLSVRKQMSHGVQFSAHYTWSHSIDGGSTWHNSLTSANGRAAGDGVTTDQLRPGLDRGNSVFDVRHRLTFNYVWELPLFRKRTGFVRAVLGDWQLNGIWSFQSGAHWTPFDSRPRSRRFTELVPSACAANAMGFVADPANCLNTGGDYNLDGIPNDRPNAAAANVNASHDQWANGFNLPDSFFTSPCLGCVGNLGRNTFVGPAFWAADMSIFKDFNFSERVHLQFRAEAFNVFNHTNFQLPGANFARKNGIDALNFGQAGGTFNPRNLQFGFKLTY